MNIERIPNKKIRTFNEIENRILQISLWYVTPYIPSCIFLYSTKLKVILSQTLRCYVTYSFIREEATNLLLPLKEFYERK